MTHPAAGAPLRLRARLVVLAVALAVPLLAAAPAGADEEEALAPRSIGAVCSGMPTEWDPFADTSGHQFGREIDCLAYAGVTVGAAAGADPLGRPAYWPDAPVTRAQMATFVVRLLDTARHTRTGDGIAALPPYDGEPRFTDVDPDSPHAANIDRLAAAGLVRGGPGGRPADRFGPDLRIERAQMASFVVRALELMTGYDFEPSGGHFTDTAGNVHERNIDVVAELGIAVGERDRFRPAGELTRGQMAAFLTRTLAFVLAEGRIVVLPGPGVTDPWDGELERELDTGVVRAEGFNAFVEEREPAWAVDRLETGAMLAAFHYNRNATTEVDDGHDDEGRVVVTATLSDLRDDSVEATRYRFVLDLDADGRYRFVEGTWEQRCQPGRGQQDFEPTPCV
jgi:hypothetical protein